MTLGFTIDSIARHRGNEQIRCRRGSAVRARDHVSKVYILLSALIDRPTERATFHITAFARVASIFSMQTLDVCVCWRANVSRRHTQSVFILGVRTRSFQSAGNALSLACVRRRCRRRRRHRRRLVESKQCVCECVLHLRAFIRSTLGCCCCCAAAVAGLRAAISGASPPHTHTQSHMRRSRALPIGWRWCVRAIKCERIYYSNWVNYGA